MERCGTRVTFADLRDDDESANPQCIGICTFAAQKMHQGKWNWSAGTADCSFREMHSQGRNGGERGGPAFAESELRDQLRRLRSLTSSHECTIQSNLHIIRLIRFVEGGIAGPTVHRAVVGSQGRQHSRLLTLPMKSDEGTIPISLAKQNLPQERNLMNKGGDASGCYRAWKLWTDFALLYQPLPHAMFRTLLAF